MRSTARPWAAAIAPPDAPARAAARAGGISAWMLLFAAAHVPLGIAVHEHAELALLHALVTVGVAWWWAATLAPAGRIACAAAYIAAAEVFWRMARVPLFWEFGKYAVAAVLLTAAVRIGRPAPVHPSLYFALLLPGAAIAFLNDTPSAARAYTSFNLSGPFALAVSAWFFSQVRLAPGTLRRMLLVALLPLLAISALTLSGILTAEEIEFTTESNVATSGGFGPNQVSAVLGLGSLIAFVYAASGGTSPWLRMALLVIALTFAGQSMMTFSRGGLYNAAGGAIAGFVFLMRDARSRLGLLLAAAVALGTVHYVLLPRLDAYTGGALRARFESVDLTNRADIAALDLEIWSDNPLLGIGVGQASYERERVQRYAAAHTEYTRMLSEHGLLGLSALLLLLWSLGRNIRRIRDPNTRAVVVSLTAWALLFMLDKATRLSVPVLLLGLGFAHFAAAPPAAARGAAGQTDGRTIAPPPPLRLLVGGRPGPGRFTR